VTWEALERAGIAPDRLMAQKVGVFVGISTADYLQMELRTLAPEAIDVYLATGGCQSVAAGRLAYFLGLQGPAVCVDTACSSSLVAVHQACQSLRSGESSLAVAGGVSLMLLPEFTINFCRARMLAADGRCKTFDKAADGYVRSEGCGVVVLKRLSDAVADGDPVLALVRGSAVNQDGRSSGLTVPNGPAQEAVIGEALRAAGLEPHEVQYVEAHGTGTPLGDPIEVQALARALGAGRTAGDPLLIGSAKTNVGHLEAAAGIAGLLKLVLSLQHRQVPPHLHFKEPNPHVNWAAMPLRVNTALADWPAPAGRRIGGVSSFGFSGTNAHVIVEEAPAPAAAPIAETACVLPLSARTDAALTELAGAMADRIQAAAEPLADICATAAVGRTHFEHRLAVTGADRASVAGALQAAAAGRDAPALVRGRAATLPTVAFLFTGLGAQYRGMGRELYDTDPVFRRAMDRCDEILRPDLGESILPVIFEDETGRLDQAAAQPALFALEYSLFERWTSLGVAPAFVAGHSLGEDVAACAAGVFSLEDGLRMVAARARLMQALPPGGAMCAVFATEEVVRAAIRGCEHELAVAAINGPENMALSGSRAALERVLEALAADGVKFRPMTASHAFHSPLMDPILGPVGDLMATVPCTEPLVELISGRTGRAASASDLAHPDYWRRHVRETVRFADVIQTLIDRGCQTFLEIGPAPTLLGLGKRCLPENFGTWVPSLRKGRGEIEQMASAAGALYVGGVNIDWRSWQAGAARPRVTLPTYPFQRERYWGVDEGGRVPAVRREAAAAAAWADATRAAADHSQVAPFDLAMSSYAAKWAALEDLTAAYMIAALGELGAFATAGERITVDALLERHGIHAEYRVLMGRWMRTLVSAGVLRPDGDGFVAPGPWPDPGLDSALARARQAFAGDASMLDYVANCGGLLVPVLTGRESALETLFPGGSPDLALGLYETSPVARYFNGIARSALAAVGGRLEQAGCRVLEIGAGTGGTTSALLPALDPSTASYTFTDVGALFLTKARERFASHAFVDYAQLDIERDPETQGFEPGSCDVVVAANVLHATRNLHATIDRTLRLLRPGGVLLLLETTRHPSWFDVSTGLIHGWQVFDDELRGDHPLLSAAQWTDLLRAHGAEDVRAYPGDGSPAEVLGQHIILARAVGVARGAAGVQAAAGTARASFTPAGLTAGTASAAESFVGQLRAAAADEAADLLRDFVRRAVARVLRIDAGTLGSTERLMDLGVDSLMAVELRNQLMTGLGAKKRLPATLIFDYPTVDAIAAHLRTQLGLADGPQPPPAAGPSPVPAAAGIESMDDAAVEALLNESLGTL
jgi:acyl transferase domain-containing protein/SAM-dependent methyltransferase